ncbi:MAG: hypothetical protein ACRDNY_09220 [Gaiellaceae bacterium]
MTPLTSSPYRRARAYVAIVALLAGAFVALSLPGTAMATACGDKVLADWFDNGRIDRLYPLHCYEEAIDAIPDDLRDYANAEEIISRALQAAVSGDLDSGGPDPTPGDSSDDPGSPGGAPGDPNDPGGGSAAAPDVDTTGISSVPIPLIVLGGMSLALLSAGGLGYLSRRRQAAIAAEGEDAAGGPDDFLP